MPNSINMGGVNGPIFGKVNRYEISKDTTLSDAIHNTLVLIICIHAKYPLIDGFHQSSEPFFHSYILLFCWRF